MAKNDEPRDHEEPIVHDKRRIDPKTGKVRHPKPEGAGDQATDRPAPDAPAAPADLEHEQVVDAGAGATAAEANADETLSEADLDFLSGQSDAEQLAAERLADLQRLSAEYANYRKRTEAGREAERERAVGDAARAMLPVLDDLDRAEKHGDLDGEGAFPTIAAKLRGVAEKLGLTSFGQAGESFDHNLHEAIFQQPSAEVQVATIAEVVEPGYLIGGTLIRAAKVVVAVPEE